MKPALWADFTNSPLDVQWMVVNYAIGQDFSLEKIDIYTHMRKHGVDCVYKAIKGLIADEDYFMPQWT